MGFLDVEDLVVWIWVGLGHFPAAEDVRMVAGVFSVSSCWVWEQ